MKLYMWGIGKKIPWIMLGVTLVLIIMLLVVVDFLKKPTDKMVSKAAGEVANLYFVPTSATLPPTGSVQLWLDAKTNNVGFIRVDLNFDINKIKLTGEIVPTNSFQQLRQISSMNLANSTGNITMLFGVGPNETVPSGKFLLATLPFGVVTSVNSQSTSINLTQIKYANGTWQTPQIINTNSVPASVLDFTYSGITFALNPLPTATPTPLPTATPTPTPVPPTSTPTPIPTATPTPLPTATPTPTPVPPTLTPTPLPTATPTPVPVVGDANGDRKVDGQDYVIWLNNYQLTSATNCPCEGDFDRNGIVDGRDYVLWLLNYGFGR